MGDVAAPQTNMAALGIKAGAGAAGAAAGPPPKTPLIVQAAGVNVTSPLPNVGAANANLIGKGGRLDFTSLVSGLALSTKLVGVTVGRSLQDSLPADFGRLAPPAINPPTMQASGTGLGSGNGGGVEIG